MVKDRACCYGPGAGNRCVDSKSAKLNALFAGFVGEGPKPSYDGSIYMAADPSDAVLGALERAVAASPDQHDLRVHLAELLLENGKSAAALEHVSTVLVVVPDHLGALRAASKAALALGDLEKAQRFTRALNALGTNPPAPKAGPAPGVPSALPKPTPGAAWVEDKAKD